MELFELKAKVYDLLKKRGMLILQSQEIEQEINALSEKIAEIENEVPIDIDTGSEFD